MSDTLDLLEVIQKGATAAAGKGPGQPLLAQDWNVLAGAIAQLAKLAAARERSEAATLARDYARADHQHIGEVTLAWFDPPTRELIAARGGAGDVVARLDGLARDTKALRGELGSLAGQVEQLRNALSDAGTENLVRDQTIGKLGVQLQGVSGLDRRITALDGRLADIDGNVRAALAFRDQLRDATGAPIDVAGLAGRVDALATAQERLKTADGEVVSIRDVENRIARLEQGGGDQALLDQRIGTRLDALAAAPDSPLVVRSAEAAAGRLDPRLAALETGLTATRGAFAEARQAAATDRAALDALDGRLAAEADRGGRVAAAVDALGALPTRLVALEAAARAADQKLGTLDGIGATLAQLRDQAAAAAALAPRVAAVESLAQAQDGRIAATETGLAALPDLRGRVVAVEASAARADALADRLASNEQGLSGLASRVTVAESQLGQLPGLANRLSVAEGSVATLGSWRLGVDQQLTALPDATSFADLRGRLSAVERSTAATTLQLGQIARTGTGTVITPVLTPVLRPPG